MRKISEILRLKSEGLSDRLIAAAIGSSRSTVQECLRRCREGSIGWPLPAGLDEAGLLARLYQRSVPAREAPAVDFVEVHRELKRPGVTRDLLWQEYKAREPQGLQYTAFCNHYRRWLARQELVLRQEHLPGDKAFMDYAGQTVPIVERLTGEVRQAQVFIAVLGCSNYTFAEASWSQKRQDWLASHVRALTYFGGAPAAIVPDNLKSAVSKARRYEPDMGEGAHSAGCYIHDHLFRASALGIEFTMRFLTPNETSERIAHLGMRLGDWGNIESLSSTAGACHPWARVPASSTNLFAFSHHVVAWLPRGEWKLVQFDNSTGWIDPMQASFLQSLMLLQTDVSQLNEKSRGAFLVDALPGRQDAADLLVGNIVFALLLFNLHAYVVSAQSRSGQLLGIQDGYVYFFGTEADVRKGESIASEFSANPYSYPTWMSDLVAAEQEKAIAK